jgi:hypothetical protein
MLFACSYYPISLWRTALQPLIGHKFHCHALDIPAQPSHVLERERRDIHFAARAKRDRPKALRQKTWVKRPFFAQAGLISWHSL